MESGLPFGLGELVGGQEIGEVTVGEQLLHQQEGGDVC